MAHTPHTVCRPCQFRDTREFVILHNVTALYGLIQSGKDRKPPPR